MLILSDSDWTDWTEWTDWNKAGYIYIYISCEM